MASRLPVKQIRSGAPALHFGSFLIFRIFFYSVFSETFDSLAPARLALRANLRLLFLKAPSFSVVVKSWSRRGRGSRQGSEELLQFLPGFLSDIGLHGEVVH